MPLHLDAVCKNIKAQLAKDLEGKMFSLKFDIGSRFGRSFLGVSVQYMKDFDVKVVFLGMPELYQKKSWKYLKTVIQNLLAEYGLNKTQIYSINTDNGANVLKTSKNILKEVAMLVQNALSQSDKTPSVDAVNAIGEMLENDHEDEDNEDDEANEWNEMDQVNIK